MLKPKFAPLSTRTWLIRSLGGKFGGLLCALVILMISAPLILEGWVGNLVLGLCSSAVIVAGLYASKPGRRTLIVGLSMAFVDIGIGRLVLLVEGRGLMIFQCFLWLWTMLFVIITILDAIFSKEAVDVETLQAALCVYLLIGLLWVYIYALISLFAPGSFLFENGPRVVWSDDRSRRSDMMHFLIFSFSTLTGSGDRGLRPISGFASICVCFQAMSGQVFLAVVIARLVGLQVGQGQRVDLKAAEGDDRSPLTIEPAEGSPSA